MPFFNVTKVEFDFTSDSGEASPEQQEETINDTLLSVWWADEEDELVDNISDHTGWCVSTIEYEKCGKRKVIYKQVIEIDGVEYATRRCDYTDAVEAWLADGVLPVNACNSEIVNYVSDDIEESGLCHCLERLRP
jgi:hypothetical protein